MEKILLDTDIGGDIDDAVCLAYLLREPRCQLLGITTVCGDSETRACVADAICKAAGENIPIAAGLDRPLQPIPVYPTPEGAGPLAVWPHDSFIKSDASAFLYEKIRENPHEITLIGIGNMTNIAVLFRDHPDAAKLLKGLSIMNGYFGAQALPQPWYNWNSWADPLASQIALSANPPVFRMFPLEFTGQLTLPAAQARRIFPASSSLVRAVLDFGRDWLTRSHILTLHDPLAAVSVFHPQVCTFRRGTVRVETEKAETMGATYFTPSAGGNVEIPAGVDREYFYRVLAEAFAR